MTKKSIRFGVTDGKGNRSSTWKCFAAKPPKNDVYLACREIGGALKVSLHETGDWRFAYTQPFFEDNLDEIDKSGKGRIIEKWSKPPQIAPGVILAIRIVIPWGSVRTPIESNIKKNIHWVNKPPDGYAIEFCLIITVKGVKTTGWPGKNGMNTRLAGSFQINSGENIWVVYREILMPKIEQQSGNPKFYKDKDKNALKTNNLRMLALDVAEDGSRVLYDFSVQYKRKST